MILAGDRVRIRTDVDWILDYAGMPKLRGAEGIVRRVDDRGLLVELIDCGYTCPTIMLRETSVEHVASGSVIRTKHIAAMYDEAARLARTMDGAPDEAAMARPVSSEGYTMDEVLQRIENLSVHARAELEDERLRALHGWPVV